MSFELSGRALRATRRGLLGAMAALALTAAPLAAGEVGDRIGKREVLGVDQAGKPVTLARFEGKPVLVVFWATWCSNCMAALPDFEAFHQRWGHRLAVLGVSTDATRGELDTFLERNPGRFSFLLSHDRRQRAARRQAVRGIPTNLLVDGEGVIRLRWLGSGLGYLAALEQELLASQ